MSDQPVNWKCQICLGPAVKRAYVTLWPGIKIQNGKPICGPCELREVKRAFDALTEEERRAFVNEGFLKEQWV